MLALNPQMVPVSTFAFSNMFNIQFSKATMFINQNHLMML